MLQNFNLHNPTDSWDIIPGNVKKSKISRTLISKDDMILSVARGTMAYQLIMAYHLNMMEEMEVIIDKNKEYACLCEAKFSV